VSASPTPLEQLASIETHWSRRIVLFTDTAALKRDLFKAIQLARTEIADPPVYPDDIETVKKTFREQWDMEVSDKFAAHYAAFVIAVTGQPERE
jgi:hypothetical protein